MTQYEINLKIFFSESTEQLKVYVAGILLMTLFRGGSRGGGGGLTWNPGSAPAFHVHNVSTSGLLINKNHIPV